MSKDNVSAHFLFQFWRAQRTTRCYALDYDYTYRELSLFNHGGHHTGLWTKQNHHSEMKLEFKLFVKIKKGECFILTLTIFPS